MPVEFFERRLSRGVEDSVSLQEPANKKGMAEGKQVPSCVGLESKLTYRMISSARKSTD